MNRRALLSVSGLTAALLLAGCGTSTSTTPAVSLEMAKAYLDAGVLALQAAAQQYIAGPPAPSAANLALVQSITAQLSVVKSALDGITVPADYKASLTEAVTLMQELSPMVAPYLGNAAIYVPLALAVLQAFIASLPPPANATAVPPAALTRKADEYHARH